MLLEPCFVKAFTDQSFCITNVELGNMPHQLPVIEFVENEQAQALMSMTVAREDGQHIHALGDFFDTISKILRSQPGRQLQVRR